MFVLDDNVRYALEPFAKVSQAKYEPVGKWAFLDHDRIQQ